MYIHPVKCTLLKRTFLWSVCYSSICHYQVPGNRFLFYDSNGSHTARLERKLDLQLAAMFLVVFLTDAETDRVQGKNRAVLFQSTSWFSHDINVSCFNNREKVCISYGLCALSAILSVVACLLWVEYSRYTSVSRNVFDLIPVLIYILLFSIVWYTRDAVWESKLRPTLPPAPLIVSLAICAIVLERFFPSSWLFRWDVLLNDTLNMLL